jgi:hypothetical protein
MSALTAADMELEPRRPGSPVSLVLQFVGSVARRSGRPSTTAR